MWELEGVRMLMRFQCSSPFLSRQWAPRSTLSSYWSVPQHILSTALKGVKMENANWILKCRTWRIRAIRHPGKQSGCIWVVWPNNAGPAHNLKTQSVNVHRQLNFHAVTHFHFDIKPCLDRWWHNSKSRNQSETQRASKSVRLAVWVCELVECWRVSRSVNQLRLYFTWKTADIEKRNEQKQKGRGKQFCLGVWN